MSVARTTFAFDTLKSHFETHGRDALVESFCVQYLVVCLYAEMEKILSAIIATRLQRVSDAQVANFILLTNDAMIKRVKKADINDLLKKFGCEEMIGGELDGTNLQPYFDAVLNRHLVAHGEGSSMTLDDFEKVLPCVDLILQKIKFDLGLLQDV